MSSGAIKALYNQPMPRTRVRARRLTIHWGIITLVAAMVCGCPHLNSGLPPPLRMPVLHESSPAEGSYHKVQAGETLDSIADRYGVDPQYLAEINNLEPPQPIKEKDEIFVPIPPAKTPDHKTQRNSTVKPLLEDRTEKMIWPVHGKVVAGFGIKEGVQRNGISIEASAGVAVLAAKDGIVGHVGVIPGYGNVVLIEHADRLVTVYARLNEAKVRQGDKVRQGSIIGALGSSGRANKPQLYFEVRLKSKPRNPLFFLNKVPSRGLT